MFQLSPSALAEQPNQIEKISGEKATSAEKTVFLVDDEDMILEVGKEMIHHLGYEVMVAASGNEALSMYEKNMDKIDIVILDMTMPDMDGEATFKRLKEIDPETKVLLSSGYTLDNRAQKIIDRGCNGFIQKPFNISELSSKIESVIKNPLCLIPETR